MAGDKPTLGDFLFRDGQAYFGSQEGKRNEMIHDVLEQEKAQTSLLRSMADRQRETTALSQYSAPQYVNVSAPSFEILPPEINVGALADELRPEFENLVASQQELAGKVDQLGYVGLKTLQESTVQTGVLKSLDRHAVNAFSQRNEALHRMGVAIIQRGATNLQLGAANAEHRLTNAQLSKANSYLAGIQSGAVRNTKDLQRSIGLSTAILSSDIGSLETSLVTALGDIGSDIGTLTDELVQTRLEVIQVLQDSQAIFLWSHREQMWVRQQILDVLSNPRRTASNEAWRIGEKCRLAGNSQAAQQMYGESLKSDPSEARNYLSLGFMSLDSGTPGEAKKYFAEAVRMAEDPKLKASALMYLGKIEMFDKNHSQAQALLQVGMNVDITNLEIWFDLAVCEMKLGNKKEALYIIRNLLFAPTRVQQKHREAAAQYALKIVAETTFVSLLPQIRQFMQEILDNNP